MLLTIYCNRPTEVKQGTVGIAYFQTTSSSITLLELR